MEPSSGDCDEACHPIPDTLFSFCGQVREREMTRAQTGSENSGPDAGCWKLPPTGSHLCSRPCLAPSLYPHLVVSASTQRLTYLCTFPTLVIFPIDPSYVTQRQSRSPPACVTIGSHPQPGSGHACPYSVGPCLPTSTLPHTTHFHFEPITSTPGPLLLLFPLAGKPLSEAISPLHHQLSASSDFPMASLCSLPCLIP